jgi:hypothetical protein
MTCKRCDHLAKPENFATAGLLSDALAVVRANVADETLVEEPPDGASVICEQPPFSALKEKHWPDTFVYRFRCSSCRTRFELAAETYHGNGGRWSLLTLSSMAGARGARLSR